MSGAFTRSGKIVLGCRYEVVLWDALDPPKMMQTAVQIAGRQLTSIERARYLWKEVFGEPRQQISATDPKTSSKTPSAR